MKTRQRYISEIHHQIGHYRTPAGRGLKAKRLPLIWLTVTLLLACQSVTSHRLYQIGEQYVGEASKPGATVRYIRDPIERASMRLRVKNGLLVDAHNIPLDPQVDRHPKRDGFAVFVMDRKGDIYISFDHQQGRFHHSSILAGAAVRAAGDMTIIQGRLLALSNSSGHYKPDAACLDVTLARLSALGVDVSQVKVTRIRPDGTRQPD